MRLSRLQKTILALGEELEFVTPADVKIAYYGFPTRSKGHHWFSVKEIGFNRYRSAGVAICRAFATIEKKGMGCFADSRLRLKSCGHK